MKTFKIIAVYSFLGLITFGCNSDYLEQEPIGSINIATLTNKNGVNGMLIGAYSLLDGSAGDSDNAQWSSLNVLATIASDEAHVGGSGNSRLTTYEFYQHDPTTTDTYAAWRFCYTAVQRANDVLRLLPEVQDITDQERTQIEAEARFLRAVYHFRAALLFRNVPYVDESITYEADNFYIGNSEPIWPKIEADFKFAADNLTETKSDVGRANSWAAKAFLAKTYMFEYKYSEAKPLLEDIITNGVTVDGKKYALVENYFDNFRTETKHGSEVVFAAQMSVYDGANGLNGNIPDRLNGPVGPPSCCYGWTAPTFDLVNAYQTDPITGLPLIDNYQNTPIKNDQGIASSEPFEPYQGTLDSRVDWVVGRRGIPYLDWGINPGSVWVRQQKISGPYMTIKNITTKERVGTDRENTAMNNPYNLIRFADVLLWAAEVEVEIGNLSNAEAYVNRVRSRAANPVGWVKTYIDPGDPSKGFTNTPAANYKVGLYTGQFTVNGKEFARKAVRFERRLELALEHHRFFDLQRYDHATYNDFNYNGNGYMANELNTYLEHETKAQGFSSTYLNGVHFSEGRNEIYPIPQTAIDINKNNGDAILKQNPGY